MPNIQNIAADTRGLVSGLELKNELFSKNLKKWEEELKSIQEVLEKSQQELDALRLNPKDTALTKLKQSLSAPKEKLSAIERLALADQKHFNTIQKKMSRIEKSLEPLKKTVLEGHEDFELLKSTLELLGTIKELLNLGNTSLESAIRKIRACQERLQTLELGLTLDKSQEKMQHSRDTFHQQLEIFSEAHETFSKLATFTSFNPNQTLTFLRQMRTTLSNDESFLDRTIAKVSKASEEHKEGLKIVDKLAA